MAATALLTLGRLPKALTLARALKSAGYRVVIAEPFRWHVARPSNAVDRSVKVPSPNHDLPGYLRALTNIIVDESVDLVVPVSEEIHHIAALRAHLPAQVRLLGPNPDQHAELHNKSRFIERAQRLGLPTPETHPADSAAAQLLAAAEDFVIKPIDGCSGIGLSLHRRGDRLPVTRRPSVIQRRIEGDTLSTLSWLQDGQELGTVVYRPQVLSGTVAVCFERVDGLVSVHDWVSKFLTGLDFTGFIGFDFILSDDGTPWPLECNPRLTSGIHFFDQSALGRMLANEAGTEPLPLNSTRKWQWSYSTLTEAYAALFKGRFGDATRALRHLVSTRDVAWSWRDPLPYFLMTPMSWELLKPAITEGISLGEACQRDIAALWSGRNAVKSGGDGRKA